MKNERLILLQNIKQRPDESDVMSLVLSCTGLTRGQVRSLRVVRQALDARKKRDVFFSLQVLVGVDDRAAEYLLRKRELMPREELPREAEPLIHGTKPMKGRVVVVGLGPAGLFAAYLLAKEGYKPLVVERGKRVSEREKDVREYWLSGVVNPESNVNFGEGGAGAFSDGKLTTRIKDPRCEMVLRTLVENGAPAEICVMAKPHVGTDLLKGVVGRLADSICELGGEILYSARLDDIVPHSGEGYKLAVNRGGERINVDCAALVLAIGQGARDSYNMLMDRGFATAAKPFAVGVRAEHPREFIDRAQLGDFAGHPRLGAAEYRLTAKSGDRGVYTFCMCPGGKVIAAASTEGQAVVNGMSKHARNDANSNAAVVVQVRTEDFGDTAKGGLEFVERMERAAFALGDGAYPACRVEDFLKGRKTRSFGSVTPSCTVGVKGVLLRDCLPDFVAEGVGRGLRAFGRELVGYDMPDAVLTGVETRTSSPVRILRDCDMQSVSHPSVYPVGEGAGYAGGIVSSAVDGLKAAESIIKRFAP